MSLFYSCGFAPIHLAACNTEIYHRMVESGGCYATEDAHQKTPLYYAINVHNTEVATEIIEKGDSANHRCNDRRTPLHDTAERGFVDIAVKLLEARSDVNAQNWNNVTPLHLAATYGRFDMVELLLQHGAAIDAQDDMGRTPLHMAAINNHAEICKFLISSDCDHTLVDKEGMKAAEVANEPLKKEINDFIIATLMNKTRGIQISESNAGICVFCQKQDAQFVFIPCKHVSLCKGCYEENKDQLKFCPMCRKTLQSVQEIKPQE